VPVAAAGLERLLPSGVTAYAALLTASANLAAGTYTEIPDAAYVRVACNAWTTVTVLTRLARQNNAALVWPAFAADRTVAAWALFDAAGIGTGNMLATGLVLNGALVHQAQLVHAGDQPRFNVGDLQVFSS